ncbi:hypothetical protein J4E86_000827 [Alternaria arbusti]|uniref:uncharacterized protein n=1 Tax=Alternaria arbusti TaxID=232088 RepID=UPI00221F4EF4|nr:uncharacterized protein J4E86_000827 [Alternaria arbusti]KAI4961798.1 hypothetical protein J4E86_000827 [Alternaria arbusti]
MSDNHRQDRVLKSDQLERAHDTKDRDARWRSYHNVVGSSIDSSSLGARERGGISHYAGVNHGTFLHIAHEEGLIRNTSIHVGIRAPVVRPKGDVRNDLRCGFEMVKARAIDRLGVAGIIDKLKSRVAGTKVYISVDIDVLDPAFAPGKLSNKTCQK